MLPWGHAAIAYLLYSAYVRSRASRLTAAGAGVVLVASQFPDLVDKPLSWHLAVLPSGRTLAHSLLTGSLLLAAAVAVFLALGANRLLVPLAVGYLSHSFADALYPILAVDYQDLSFLAWPVLPTPVYDGPKSVLGIFSQVEPLAPFFLLQLLLLILALIAWHADGHPGLAPVRTLITPTTDAR